jgi:hypothetical protein
MFDVEIKKMRAVFLKVDVEKTKVVLGSVKKPLIERIRPTF